MYDHDKLIREIFEGTWGISVKVRDLRTEKELALEPDSMYGVPQHVQEAANETIVTYVTINAMVELWKNRRNFTINRPGDVKPIYEIINNYINSYLQMSKDSVNNGKVPIDDLILLDELAHYLYPNATRGQELQKSIMERFGMGSIMSKQEILGNIPAHVNKTAPNRYRLADSIIDLHKG